MNKNTVACLLSLGCVFGCSDRAPELLVSAPAVIQRGLELGVFKDLRARLTVGTVNSGSVSPSSVPETPLPGCPFGEEVDLEPDGSFSVKCTTQGMPGNLFAVAAYEEHGYIDSEHVDPLILIEMQRPVQVYTEGNSNNANVSFDDAVTSTNIRDNERYDGNHNGVSNLGDIFQGWDPQAAAVDWALKLEGLPSGMSSGMGTFFELALLPPAGEQMLVTAHWDNGSGMLMYVAIVDTASPSTILWSSASSFAPTVDAPRARILMVRCDGTGGVSQCYLDSIDFSGGGYKSVATHRWDQGYHQHTSAPAVQDNGTTWLVVHDNARPALVSVSEDGSTVSGLLQISGAADLSCVAGPAFNNTWIQGSTLYAFYQASANMCDSLSCGDAKVAAISLGGSPAIGTPFSVGDAACNIWPPRIAIDTAGNAIYAASKNELRAYALTGTRLWTSAPVDLTSQQCGASDFTVQNTSVPLVASTGDILAIFGGCEVFAYASAGQPSAPQPAKWHRELKKNNPFNQGAVLGSFGLAEALADGQVALTAAYPDDPGAAQPGRDYHDNSNSLQQPIGGVAIDLAAASPERVGISGFVAIAPQYRNTMNPQTAGQYQPKSDVLAYAGKTYFVTDVFTTPTGVTELTCLSPPCYYLVAAQNSPLVP